jgi:UDP-N-acetyl-2-amino-2-deoxyglucuronate dehydrogenase
MISVFDEAGVNLGVISQRRLYPPVQRVKYAIDPGKIGKPVFGVMMMFGWRDEDYYRSDPWRGTREKEGGGVGESGVSSTRFVATVHWAH